jgi:predicted RNase H-like HicB family nuclease
MEISTHPIDPEQLARYMNMRYTILITPEEDGWGARIVELPGCVAGGDTIEETLAMLAEAKEAWIGGSLKSGDPVPEPLEDGSEVLDVWYKHKR